MDEEEKRSADEFLNEVHGEGASESGLEYDLSVTDEDILLYLNRHPYLQILNLDPTFEEFDSVKLTQSKCGWPIQDFGDALSSSQGEKMFDGIGAITLFADDEDDGAGASDLTPGDGTVVKQAFDTAVEMVEMIKERWSGLHIVAGAEVMKWAAWVVANDLGMEVYGYEPSKEAEARAQRLKRYEMQKSSAKQMGRSQE